MWSQAPGFAGITHAPKASGHTLKTMKIETTTGKYAIVLTGTVQPEKAGELQALGVAQGLLYRGVFAELRETTGAKRRYENCADFDSAIAEKVNVAISKAVKDYLTDVRVDVSEYVPSESGDNKPTQEATELWTKIQTLPEAEFDKKLAVLGLGDDYDDASAILAIRNKLREARQRAAEAAKNALGV